MQRSAATVVCLVGGEAAAVLAAVAAPNVVVLAVPAEDAVERARRATEGAAGVHSPYCLHDADPLDGVARAWVRLFEESGPVGEVEVAVADTVARWRARTVELPDYYLVTAVDDLSDTWRHWYFGILHRAAAARVVPVASEAPAVLGALEALHPGPWWPPLDRLLDGLERRPPPAGPSPGEPVTGEPGRGSRLLR